MGRVLKSPEKAERAPSARIIDLKWAGPGLVCFLNSSFIRRASMSPNHNSLTLGPAS